MIEDPNPGSAQLLLSCLNCTIQLSALKGFKCNPILRELADAIRSELHSIAVEIAHLDMSLAPDADVDVQGVATLHGSKHRFELGSELDEPVERGRLELTIRALAKPDHLHAAVTRAMNHTWAIFPNLFARLGEMQHFQPPSASSSSRITGS
jgi:hypothetical protein